MALKERNADKDSNQKQPQISSLFYSKGAFFPSVWMWKWNVKKEKRKS